MVHVPFGRLLRRGRAAMLALALAAPVACVSTGDKTAANGRPTEPPPPVTPAMPLGDALTAAINFGGDTLQNVRQLIKRRGEEAAAVAALQKDIASNLNSYEHHQLMNAGALLVALPGALPVPLMQKMIGADRPLARQMGWQFAAAKPAPDVSREIDRVLTQVVMTNEIDTVLMPQMANAVRANRLKSAYTMMRQGLMTRGDDEFVRTMISLDPVRASDDFLVYLGMAPAEELRQLSTSSVNLYTCIAILKHMRQVPPSMGAPGFEHLFAYAVSRNGALAELADAVVESYVPTRTEILAQILARQPAWLQIAYLEGARRQMTPKVGLILAELRNTTTESDVVQEIDEIKY